MGRFLLVFLLALPASAQTDCSKIASAQNATYGFRPSQLSETQRAEKSAQMDAFWKLVKDSGPTGVSCLRGLVERQTDRFASFDEATLLYSLDPSPASGAVCARGVGRADLADIDPAEYIRFALQLAKQGTDIKAVAQNYINANNDVTVYLPLHGAYKLDRTAGALLLYAVMPTNEIDDSLSAEVKSSSADTRNSAAIVWSMNLSERSFKGLAALDQTNLSAQAKKQIRSVLTPFKVQVGPPKYTRAQMLAKIAKFPEMDFDPAVDLKAESDAMDNSVYATFTPADVEVLRESRRKMITGVSNESVENYIEISRVLLNLINKLNLYAEYRKGQ
jgi:hypothetical protein